MGPLNLVKFVDMTHTYNTLVVVDDNPAILTALKICLAAEFERIVTLTSPDTLVATLAKEEAVDAVLLDMNFSLGVNTGQDGTKTGSENQQWCGGERLHAGRVDA